MRFFRNFHLMKGYPPAFIADFSLRKGRFLSWKFLFRHWDFSKKSVFFRKMIFFVSSWGKCGFRVLCVSFGVFLALRKCQPSNIWQCAVQEWNKIETKRAFEIQLFLVLLKRKTLASSLKKAYIWFKEVTLILHDLWKWMTKSLKSWLKIDKLQ